MPTFSNSQHLYIEEVISTQKSTASSNTISFIFIGVVNSQLSCLTWELKGKTLSLICRIQNQVDPVSFNDSKGYLKAKCILKNRSKCETFQINANTIVNTYTNEIVLMINDYDRQRFINDEWSCSQGNRIWTTVVSASKGKRILIL